MGCYSKNGSNSDIPSSYLGCRLIYLGRAQKNLVDFFLGYAVRFFSVLIYHTKIIKKLALYFSKKYCYM